MYSRLERQPRRTFEQEAGAEPGADIKFAKSDMSMHIRGGGEGQGGPRGERAHQLNMYAREAQEADAGEVSAEDLFDLKTSELHQHVCFTLYT